MGGGVSKVAPAPAPAAGAPPAPANNPPPACEAHALARTGAEHALLVLLLERRPDLTERDSSDNLPLYYCCLHGHVRCLAWLLIAMGGLDAVPQEERLRCATNALSMEVRQLMTGATKPHGARPPIPSAPLLTLSAGRGGDGDSEGGEERAARGPARGRGRHAHRQPLRVTAARRMTQPVLDAIRRERLLLVRGLRGRPRSARDCAPAHARTCKQSSTARLRTRTGPSWLVCCNKRVTLPRVNLGDFL